MQRRDFQLMIMESAGGPVRRARLPRRWLVLAAGGVSVAVFVSLAILVHLVMLRGVVHENTQLREANQTLSDVVAEVEAGIPDVERGVMRSETAFRQLWTKSGLGVEPSLLGIGPVEGETELPEKSVGRVGGTDPLALGLELGRVADDASQARRTLNDLLEYFNDAEQMLSNTPSIRPSDSPWLTSGFGKRRDPVDGRWMMHKGLDIGGSPGSPIKAPADGVVIFVGTRGGYGRTVVLDHGYGYQTHFAHLSGFAVSVGDRIERGALIAYMGSTGKSTGPHLHYEVRRHGQPLDPMRFILD